VVTGAVGPGPPAELAVSPVAPLAVVVGGEATEAAGTVWVEGDAAPLPSPDEHDAATSPQATTTAPTGTGIAQAMGSSLAGGADYGRQAMRFSFWTSNALPWDEILAGASHAAATGWDGVWFADHFMPYTADDTGPMHESWTVVAALAASVPDVRIGPLVSGNTYRHPAVLAKMATTVDHISGGRCVLGLGAGWQENEHTAYGIELPEVAERLDRLEEACQVIRGLLDNDHTDFNGKHYRLEQAPLSPKPVRGAMPLMIGGGGERRTLRIVAAYADEWNVWGDPEIMTHKNAVLDRHCAQVGRDPAAIQRSAVALLMMSDDEAYLARARQRDTGRPTVVGTPTQVAETVAAYRDAGVDELIVPDFTLGPMQRKIETMDRFIGEVAPAFR